MNKQRLERVLGHINIHNPKVCYGIIGHSFSLFEGARLGSLVQEQFKKSTLFCIDNNKIFHPYGYQNVKLLKQPIYVDDLYDFYTSSLEDFLKDEENSCSFMIIIDNFEQLQPKEQTRMIAAYRSWQQNSDIIKNKLLRISLILCGSWSYNALEYQWGVDNDSPHPDVTDVINIPRLSCIDIAEYLLKKYGIIDHEKLMNYSHFIYDLTAGDCFFLEKLIGPVKNIQELSMLKLEELALGLPKRILDSLRERVECLNNDQIFVLKELCEKQICVSERKDVNIEILETLGLIKMINIPSSRKIVVELSSDIIGKIFRNNNIFGKIEGTFPNSELISISCASNEIAYRSILRIENLLRNLVVLVLCNNQESLISFLRKQEIYQEDIKKTKIKKYVKKENKYIVETLCSTEKKLLADIIEKSMDKEMSIETAKLLLDNPSSISFLTATELCLKVILFFWDNYFHCIFKDKKQFCDVADRFFKIRNHIAHNRIVSCEAIEELKNIEIWFLMNIGNRS